MDHPRLRGEHVGKIIDLPLEEGSPPPTRGTQQLSVYTDTAYRITPAYAGNTTTSCLQYSLNRDHPRLRGEHQFERVEVLKVVGSPPPTRGTRVTVILKKRTLRITPAYAGNTGKKYFTCFPSQDHPRLRGEHSHEHNQYFLTSGSPPPTRGTPV